MGLIKTTLGERGFLLAVGLNGGRDRDIEFRELYTAEEIEIGKIRKATSNPARQATRILAYMTTRIGSVDLSTMERKDAESTIRSMVQGDFLHAWALCRISSLGVDDFGWTLTIDKVTCQHCGTDMGKKSFDLHDADLTVCDDGDATFPIILPVAIEVGGKQTKELEASPYPWHIVERVFEPDNAMPLNLLELFGSSIHPKDNANVMIHQGVKMRKPVIDAISQAIDKHRPGPALELEVDCENCSRVHRESYDWRYGTYFFTNFSSST